MKHFSTHIVWLHMALYTLIPETIIAMEQKLGQKERAANEMTLLLAVQQGTKKMVQRLLQEDIDPTTEHDGKKLLHHAQSPKIRNLLQDAIRKRIKTAIKAIRIQFYRLGRGVPELEKMILEHAFPEEHNEDEYKNATALKSEQ